MATVVDSDDIMLLFPATDLTSEKLARPRLRLRWEAGVPEPWKVERTEAASPETDMLDEVGW